MHAFMLKGYGDDLVICDISQATEAILSLMPLDTFVDQPVTLMQMVDNPYGTVPGFAHMPTVLHMIKGSPGLHGDA